jgi:uncharacterized membrane protein
MQDTFSVSGFVWTSGYEDSESWDLDCNGRVVVISQSVCHCDDRRTHHHDYQLNTKAEILVAEMAIESILSDIDDMDKGGVFIRSRPSWYQNPHLREMWDETTF